LEPDPDEYRDVVKMLEADGWFLVRTKGSHRVYPHPVKTGNVIVSMHNLGKDIATGTCKAILKQAGIQ
jgi:predicted RNA binding protein YcfA (HicA-like mRNA interferase family)